MYIFHCKHFPGVERTRQISARGRRRRLKLVRAPGGKNTAGELSPRKSVVAGGGTACEAFEVQAREDGFGLSDEIFR